MGIACGTYESTEKRKTNLEGKKALDDPRIS